MYGFSARGRSEVHEGKDSEQRNQRYLRGIAAHPSSSSAEAQPAEALFKGRFLDHLALFRSLQLPVKILECATEIIFLFGN
jgi:hypothetical protein